MKPLLIVSFLLLSVKLSESCQLDIFEGLINYWTFNHNLNEQINKNRDVQGKNVLFVNNRVGVCNSAVYLKQGFIDISGMIDFQSNFTIAAWVNVRSRGKFSRLIDCGTSNDGKNNIVTGLSYQTTGYPYFETNNNYKTIMYSTISKFSIGVWTHVAFVYFSNEGRIYFNGKLEKKGSLATPARISRTKCYIGQSWDSKNSLADAYIDDLMVFNSSLDSCTIQKLAEYNTISPTSSTTKRALKSTQASSKVTATTPTATKAPTTGLIDYWAFNGNMYDKVSKLTMNGSFNYVNDRNGRANSAIDFAGGFAMIPSCASTSILTMALWIFISVLSDYANVIDLNNDYYALSSQFNQIRFFVDGQLYSTSAYGKDVWTHVATTLDGSMSYLYVNGAVEWRGPHALPVYRGTTCSFGWYKSGWNLYAYLDDVYFYNRALTAAEVLIVMNSNT